MRVSSEFDRQTTNLQRDALLAAGLDSRYLFEDHASGAKDDRPGLAAARRQGRVGGRLLPPPTPERDRLQGASPCHPSALSLRRRLGSRTSASPRRAWAADIIAMPQSPLDAVMHVAFVMHGGIVAKTPGGMK
jgi:hypothetical protein